MSWQIRNRFFCFLWAGMILICFSIGAQAQSEKKKTIRSKVEYFQDKNQIGRLITTLRIREDRNAPLEDAWVIFYSVSDTSKILLDSVQSNSEGQATCMLLEPQKIYKDSLGLMSFESEFVENEDYKGSISTIQIQDAKLDLSFFQRDSIKYIAAEAFEVRPDGTTPPISEVDLTFYIQGTFSRLNIGEEESDEEGRATLEFPVDMPGDSTGVLTIVANIDDHDLYGNLESIGKINWGKPVPIEVEVHRGLGDTDAPLWMVYTLIVLLSAVWFHYMYIIFMIIKIKMSRNEIPSVQDLI